MLDEYVYKMETIINKNTKSLFCIDYKKAIHEIIEGYNNIFNKINKNQKDEYLGNFFNLLFSISTNLNRKQFKQYIKNLKEYEIHKYKDNNFFIKNFLKLYIILYMVKIKNFNFFKNKYITFLSKRTQKRIYLFFSKKHSNFLTRLKTLLPNKVYVEYMELVITTKCTLNCKNCANLMPMYKKPYDVDKNTIIDSINKLKSSVDQILLFRILGGEPFCNPNLKYYLKEMAKEKFKNIVIVTNGTLVPKDPELINIIKDKNISIEISNYGILSRKKDDLIKLLEKEKINYKLGEEYRIWYDYGILTNKKRTHEELKRQFFKCNINCKSILNGKIYYCPRHGHGIDLGIIKQDKKQYVDLLNNSDNENRKQIKKLMLRNKYVDACNYCNYATKDCKSIPAAIQLKRK